MIASRRRVLFVTQLLISTPFRTIAMASTTKTKNNMIIDSHLHVWASETEAKGGGFPYAEGQTPPESLRNVASKTSLLKHMDSNGVDGSLIVQPINHKFDHSYVLSAIREYPGRFKAMLLHDPSLDVEKAVDQLEDLVLKGFVGVRFNPYLWPKIGDSAWTPMSTPDGAGLAVYKRCGQLKMPVGVMCFQGLNLHYDDIITLLESSPDTTMILDHFGFTSFTPDGEQAFQKLLKLADYPQTIIKISALFRLNDPSPYDRVRKERFEPLLAAFGANRLMFGTDFPFVTEQPDNYDGMVKLVSSWMDDDIKTKNAVMGGTAERLFGPWGHQGTVAND